MVAVPVFVQGQRGAIHAPSLGSSTDETGRAYELPKCHCNLTSGLSGARNRRHFRSAVYPHRRPPPWLVEDTSARPLQSIVRSSSQRSRKDRSDRVISTCTEDGTHHLRPREAMRRTSPIEPIAK